MTPDQDLQQAKEFGEMRADVRTIKHDIVNIQASITAIGMRLNTMDTGKARGLGFFAGAAFVLTSCSTLLLAAVKYIFTGH